MKNERITRTVWVIANKEPRLPKGDKRKGVVYYVHFDAYANTHTEEPTLEGAMEFSSKFDADDYHGYTLRGHYSRALEAVQVVVTTTYKIS